MTPAVFKVATFEYLRHLRQRRFLVTTFGIPVLMAVVVALALVGARAVGGSPGPWALVGGGELPDISRHYASLEEAEAAVKAGEIAGYVSLEPDGRAYVRATGNVPEDLAQTLFDRAQTAAVLEAPAPVREALVDPAQVVEEAGADETVTTQRRDTTSSTLAVGSALLFALAVLGASSFLVQAVTEEKENRILEVLVSSVRPGDLIGGKVAGLGLLSLTQTGSWAAVAAVGAWWVGILPRPDELRVGALLASLPFFAFGYLLYAALIVGIGVVVAAPREAQQLTGFLGLFLVLPFVLVGVLAVRPSGPVAVAFSLFPFTAPTVMPMRLVLSPVAAGSYAAGLAILVGSALVMIWLVGRLFRAAMLLSGQRLSARAARDALVSEPSPLPGWRGEA